MCFTSPQLDPLKTLCPFVSLTRFWTARLQSLEHARKLAALQDQETELGVDPERRVSGYISFKKGLKVSSYRKADHIFKIEVEKLINALGREADLPANDDPSRDKEVLVAGINPQFVELFVSSVVMSGLTPACKAAFERSPFHHKLRHILEDIIAFGAAPQKLPIALAA